MSMRIFHPLKSVSLLAVISTGKSQVTTHVLLRQATKGCHARGLLDCTWLVEGRGGILRFVPTSHSSYCGTGRQ